MNADQTMKIDHTMKMTSKTLSSRWGAQSIDMESKRANITGPSMNSKVRADFGQSIKGMQQQAPQYKDNQFFIDQIDSIRKTANLKGKFSKMTTANAAKDNVSFSVSGASTNVVKDNFQDNYFGGAVRNIRRNIGGFARPQQRMRASVAMMALPPWAEGDWGDEIKKRKYMVGGNWKCNGDFDFAVNFPKDVLNKSEFSADNMDVAVAPTYLHLSSVKAGLDSKVNLCAQDVSEKEEGAFTGNISAKQLTDMGINWTLTGHSERRELFGETDEITALKTKLAIENGMNVMLCIGEKKEERENGFTDEVNARQLEAVKDALETSQWGNVVIAYEPVWAIGTGLTATPEIAQDTHFNIRCWLAENISPEVAAATRILYGGSANAQNAPDLIK